MIIICHQFVNISIRELRITGSVIWKMINVFVEGILIKWTSNSAVKYVLIFVKMCRLRLYLVTCLACVSIVMDLTDKFNFMLSKQKSWGELNSKVELARNSSIDIFLKTLFQISHIQQPLPSRSFFSIINKLSMKIFCNFCLL